jgi:hypothetical protein
MAANVRRLPAKKNRESAGNGALSDDDLKQLVPDGLARSFVNSKLHDKALALAGLGEPGEWEGEMPELPNDIAGVDHDELSNLHAQFVNAYSTAIWFASRYYVEADAYEAIADYLTDRAVLQTDQSNEQKRRAEAHTDDGVVAARAMHRDAYHNYVRFRDIAGTLDRKAKAVSRIGGFIGDEADNEERSALKSSTRGRAAGGSKGTSKGALKRVARR